MIGIPSAFLLHGYVGFIFGSIKANPWWSSPLMPIVFLFSAMVSGHRRGDVAVHGHLHEAEKDPIDMRCLDTIAKYLFYTFVIDFTLEMLDLIHRTYESRRVLPQPGFHGAHAALVLAGGPPDCAWERWFRSRCWRQINSGSSARGARRMMYVAACADPGRDLRHALERGDRRPAFLQELPGLHHLQDGIRHPRRAARRRLR